MSNASVDGYGSGMAHSSRAEWRFSSREMTMPTRHIGTGDSRRKYSGALASVPLDEFHRAPGNLCGFALTLARRLDVPYVGIVKVGAIIMPHGIGDRLMASSKAFHTDRLGRHMHHTAISDIAASLIAYRLSSVIVKSSRTDDILELQHGSALKSS